LQDGEIDKLIQVNGIDTISWIHELIVIYHNAKREFSDMDSTGTVN